MGKTRKIKLFFSLLILFGLLGITGWWITERISLSERGSLEIVIYPANIF